MPEKESKEEHSKVRTAKAEPTAVGVVTTEAVVRVTVSWDEVKRLFDNEEYSAAMLVAAVNIEYVLTRYIARCQSIVDKENVTTKCDISSLFGRDPEKISLGNLYKVAKHLSDEHAQKLEENWKEQVEPIIKHRNRIAHKHAYFKRLRELKIISKKEIKQIINNARKFCHDNPQ